MKLTASERLRLLAASNSNLTHDDFMAVMEGSRKIDAQEAALEAAMKLCTIALPKFNWGASALDAESIKLLNETPAKIARALEN